MFGMEKEKELESKFRLEEELFNLNRKRELEDLALDRILKIKDLLSKGGNKEFINKIGVLLHGYIAFKNIVKKYKY